MEIKNQARENKARDLAEIVTNPANPDVEERNYEYARAFLEYRDAGWFAQASKSLEKLLLDSEIMPLINNPREAANCLPGVGPDDIGRLNGYLENQS